MNATLEQIKPETVELLEKQAAKFGLSVDDYLRRLLPHGENELALKAETSDEMKTSEESAEEREIKRQPEDNAVIKWLESDQLAEETVEEKETRRQKSIAWIKSHVVEYGGKYVALDGDKLIAVGERHGDALKAAIEAGYKKAFVGFIHPSNYVGYMGGWN